MKINKAFLKENKNLLIRMLVMSLIGVVAIFADIWLKIDSKVLNELIVLLFSTVTVIAGLWISCYLLFLQLYKDRYPIKVLKECYLPNMRYNFAVVVFCIVYGSVVIVINNGVIANLYYSAVCVTTILEIMIKIYNTNKSLMINTYVDKVFQEIKQDLDNSKNIIKKETFKNVQYILDESIVKEEYFIVQNITERLGDVYRSFLQNSLRFEGENAEINDVEKSFENIINFNINELKMCKKINSEITIDKVVAQQIKNIKFCIDKNQYEWFKKYIEEYSFFLFKTQKENNPAFTEKLYGTYRSIIKNLIEEEKNEWLKFVIEKLRNVINSLVFFYEDVGVRSYCNLLSGAIVFCLEEGKEKTESYKILLNSFREFSSLISKNSAAFNNVKMCYSLLFNELLNKSYEEAFLFYEKVLERIFRGTEDAVFLEFKMYCISELINKGKLNASAEEKILNKQIDVIVEIIGIKGNYQGYLLLPDFEKLINDRQYSKEEFKKIKEKIYDLLNSCIVKDNLPMFYTLINKLNDVLLSTEQRQKELQEELIDIYIAFIYKTRALVNQQYLEILFQLFERVIKEMDEKRKISSNLGDYIISSISGVAQNGNKESRVVVIKAIDLLYSFLNEDEHMNFVITSSDKKQRLYRAMFNIGTDCIENNFEEGLRRVSNSLGWFTINSLKQGTAELTIYLIERATELYSISKSMEVSSKTLTFILTLFTTVGTFCCKNQSYSKFLKKVLDGIITEDVSKIKTAISLRTSENDTWNHLFENDTINLSKKFIAEFEKYQSIK